MKGDQRGSALVLVPAAVMSLIVLAAVAVDFSIAFLGERELANATAAAANDAAGSAIDEDALRERDQLVLDPARAAEVVRRSLAARGHVPVRIDRVAVSVDGLQVRVTASGEVDYIFSKAVPGGPRQARVEATSTAEFRTG